MNLVISDLKSNTAKLSNSLGEKSVDYGEMIVSYEIKEIDRANGFIDATLKIENTYGDKWQDYFIDFLIEGDAYKIYTKMPYDQRIVYEDGIKCLYIDYKLALLDKGNDFIIRVLEGETGRIYQKPAEIIQTGEWNGGVANLRN